ncbi:MAG: hypothetical protein PWQ75_638 [Methanolobus sp.]|nr:hypothetical protein [Methanolobus sp.]
MCTAQNESNDISDADLGYFKGESMHPIIKNSKENGVLNYIRVLLSISIVLSIFNPVLIASAVPNNPEIIGNTTGNFWVLHEWEPANGENITDGYNVSYNGTWTYVTESKFNHTELDAHDWSNITIYAYNISSSTMSSGVESNVQLPNNPISIEDVESSLVVDVGDTVHVDANFTDYDDDIATFECNRSFDLFTDFDNINGTGSWIPVNAGTYYVNFTVSDDYGSNDFAVMNITVNEATPEVFTPATPVNFVNTTGNFWVLHDWEAGTGNVTDGYNVSYNGTWYNITDSTDSDFNTSLNAHDWSNITVYAYNATSSLLSSEIESNVQIPNNPMNITDVDSSIDVNVSETVYVDVNFTDADGDSPTFTCNLSDFTDFDTFNGTGSWIPENAGTYYVNFTVSDDYGSNDFAIMEVNVSEVVPVVYTPADPVNFINTTGNFWVLHDWEAGDGNVTDGYNVSYNGTWYNITDSTDSDFNNTIDLTAHSWSNITVYAYNATSSTLSSPGVESNVQIPNNPINITDIASSYHLNKGDTLNIDANYTDIDGDNAIFSSNNTDIINIASSSGVASWTPNFKKDAGTYYVNLTVSDEHGSEDSQVVMITVAQNNEPVFTMNTSYNISEGNTLSFTLNATDADGDTLVYDDIDLPSNATFDSGSAEFTWTPGYDMEGDYTANFSVYDGEDFVYQEVAITVDNTNRAPKFPSFGEIPAAENSTLELNVSAIDPDNDSLDYTCNATFGTMDNSTFIWTPNYDSEGKYDVLFTVSDGYMDDVAVVTINVSNTNRAPTLDYINSISVNETEEVRIVLNATDPDGDNPLYYSKNNTNLGNLTDNVFVWIPGYDDKGIQRINFTVSDGDLSSTQTAVIGVNNTNRAPEFTTSISGKTINESEYISLTATAIDSDGDNLTYSISISGDPDNTTVSTVPSGGMTFSWTPSYIEAGNYTVTFIVEDELQYSDTLQVPIQVLDVNREPYFESLNSSYTINESDTLEITLGANDLDVEDKDSINVWINNTGNASGELIGDVYTWETDYHDNGTYIIEFVISDGTANTSNTTMIIVNDINAPPELEKIGSKEVEEGDTLSFTISATDEDEDDNGNLTYYTSNFFNNNATFNNETHVFTWTPVSGEAGEYNLTFYVTDGEDTVNEKVFITVTETSSSSSSTTSSSGGGGGGGGGALSSGEEFDNIDFKDYTLKSVVRDVETTFSFYGENNSIVSLSFTSELNGGQVKAVIEVLKDTSSQVGSAAPGDVYKNMNIYIDSNLGDDVLGDRVINFKVDKVWVEENNIDLSFITLCRYNSGEWDLLSTEATEEDEEYYYFTSTTPGFSSYAISSVDLSAIAEEASAEKIEETSVDIEQMKSTEDDDNVPLESGADLPQKESSSFPYLLIIGLIGLVAIGVVGYRNRDYYEKVKLQIGNPDGKRYRRIKK